ncbi:hypothetical protein AB0H58_01760 [Nocardia neocaledoniensis]|uniref:hypothetical protein n=1 Tax=Nocardia neocaledoniensis TaxID=236511 RepID=UPI0033C79645
MVAIIRCTPRELNHIEFKERLYPPSRREEWDWTLVRDDRLWTKGRHLTLIVTPDHAGVMWVSRLGLTKREKERTSTGQKLRVLHTAVLEPRVQLDTIVNKLRPQHRRHLVPEGQLSDGTGNALISALVDERPNAQEIIDYINATRDGFAIRPGSKAEEALSIARDGTIAVARMAGMSIPQLSRWDPPAEALQDVDEPPAYLDLLHHAADQSESAENYALEDHLINRDTENMLGWLSAPTGHVAWRQFQQNGQRLFIANANRTAAERISGADVIYYHENRQSLILVQYKKLDARRNGYYYPDSDRNLEDELGRLRAVDRYVAHFRSSDDDHRLCPDPSWIKLCRPESVIPQADVMVPGMYFSRKHFESLRADPRLRDGRGGSVRFGYSNVPNYLDNTMFTRLVETGMIGTAGIGTELVRQQISRTFKKGRMLIFGLLTGEEKPQSVRNSARRKGR